MSVTFAGANGSQTSTHLSCCGIKFASITDPPLRIDPERVTAVSRKDVQMNMRNLLEGDFTIGKEKIHAFAPDAGAT
jgi:hypothetical protein